MIQFILNNKPFTQTDREDLIPYYLNLGCEEVTVLYQDNLLKPIWNGSEWIEGATPEEIAEANKPIVPSIITARQLRLQLVLSGFDLNTIDLIIDSLPEPNKSIARVSWEYATTFEREHQMLGLIAQQLGISQTELDTIFINAEKL